MVGIVLSLVATLLSLLHLSASLTVSGKISVPPQFGFNEELSNYMITLNGNEFSTLTDASGKFNFHNVPTGVYSLDVLSVHEVFPQIKLKIDDESKSINVTENKYPGAKRFQVSYPIHIVAVAPVSYFQQHPPFNPISFVLGNPMMLMMLFSVGILIFFPMLTQGLDEEQLKELQQGTDGDPMQNIKKLFGMETNNNNDDD